MGDTEQVLDANTEQENETKEINTEELEVEVKDVPSSGEEADDGAKIVGEIKKEVLGIDDAKEEEGKDIPDAFTNACLDQGWTQKEITDFAFDLDDEVLLELIPELLDKEEKQIDTELGKDQAKQEIKSKPPDATVKDPTNEELTIVKKELAEIRASMGEAKKVKATQDEEAMVQTINQVFDEASKTFEIFGKTDELLKYPAGPRKGQFVPTSVAMKARNSVWEKALPFIEKGIPVNDAMEIGLTWYKGANLEKDIERNLIKDLKKHETKLSAKRTGKRTVKTYADEDERKESVVREAARKAGVKGRFDL